MITNEFENVSRFSSFLASVEWRLPFLGDWFAHLEISSKYRPRYLVFNEVNGVYVLQKWDEPGRKKKKLKYTDQAKVELSGEATRLLHTSILCCLENRMI